VDVLSCPKCGGRMRFIALIGQDQPEVVEKILRSYFPHFTSAISRQAGGPCG